MSNSEFHDAQSAARLTDSILTASNVTFNNLGKDNIGGALFSSNTNITLSDSKFTNNKAIKGGSMHLQCPGT
jgi:hypothetical protein